MITLAEAKALRPRQVLVDRHKRRWYVNGMVKTWKTDPSRIRIPLKHGLYTYDALTDTDFIDGICDHMTIEDNNNTQGAK